MGNTFNEVMASKIINEAQAVSGTIMAKGRAQSKLEGIAMAKAGKGAREIKEDMTTFDKIFGGGASVQAAHAFALDAAVDEYHSGIVSNMPELRKKSPEQFAAEQADVFAAHMTGDAELDTEVMLRAEKAVAAASKLHAKEWSIYEQERTLGDYTNRVSKAQERVKASISLSARDKQEAQENLYTAIQRPEGMDEDAYKSALLSMDKLYMEQGDSSLHHHLPNLLNMTPEDLIAFQASEALHTKKIQQDNAIRISKEISDIEEAADAGASDAKLMQMMQDVRNTHGPEVLTEGRIISILTKKAKGYTDKMSNQEKVSIYLSPGGGHQFSGKEGAQVMALANMAIREMYKDDPVKAEAMILRKWSEHGIQDPVMERRVRHEMQRPLVGGEVNAQYASLLGELEPYFQANPEKTKAMFNDTAELQRFLTIRDAVQSGEMDMFAAIRMFEDKDAVAARMEFAKSPEFRKAVDNLAEEILSGNRDMPFVNDLHWRAAQNQPEMRAAIRSAMLHAASKSGHTENLEQAAWAQLKKDYSIVNDQWVRTGTKSLQDRFMINGPVTSKDNPDAVMNHFFDTAFKTDFPGYDKSQVRVKIDRPSNTMTFWLEDELGILTAPYGTNFGRKTYQIDEIGAMYQTEVMEPRQIKQLEENKADAAKELNRMRRLLIADNDLYGRGKTDEEIEIEAIERVNQESFISKATSAVANAFLEQWGFGRQDPDADYTDIIPNREE